MSNIGVLPEKWKFSKLKFALNQIKDGTHGTFARTMEGRPFLSAKNVYSNEIVISENESMISEEDYKEITKNGFPKRGDLLLTIVGTIGRVNLYELDEPLAFQRSVAFLRLSKNYNPRYYFYYLQSDHYLEELMTYAKTSAQSGVYMGDVSNTYIVIPPLELQGIIADYLDDKVSKINDLIKDKEQLIQLLNEKRQSMITEAVTKGLNSNMKMKDSGVEWIGEIPEHWESTRLKYLLKNGLEGIKIGPFGSALKLEMMVDSGYKVYGQENLIKNDFALGNRFLSADKFEELKNYEIIEGDVLVSMMGTIGKCKVVPRNIIQGIMDSHLIRMRFNENRIIPDYIALVITEANYIKEQLNLNSKGSIMSGLNSSIIKSLNISLPSVEEQRRILDFLNKQDSNLQGIINAMKIQIQKLKDYRQSLIYEAVTGKIDVRDFEVKA